jgi:8-oxo-dGTP diphosphatase
MTARYMNLPPLTRQNANIREGTSIALFKGRKVLLVRRRNAPYAGLWSLPGGKTEAGEVSRDAVRRELKEETGLAADIQGIVDSVSVAPDTESGRYLLTVFYGRPSGGDLKAGGDADDAEWVALEEIGTRPLTPGTADLIWIAAHRARTG